MTLLSPTPELVTPVEMVVPGPAGSTADLRIDGRSVRWGHRTVALEAVTAVAYAARRRRRLFGRSAVERRVSLWHADGEPLVIELVGSTRWVTFEAAHRAAYAAVTSVVHATVEPRLRAEILRRMAIGDTVAMGTLHMDTAGVRDASGFASGWTDLPVAVIEGDRVALTHRVERDIVHHHHVAASTPNAVLLPELFDDAAVAFS